MIVMKFGGTSVGTADAIRKTAQAVLSSRAESPIVVVSALAKVTDALLALEGLATAGDASRLDAAVQALERRHDEVAGDLGVSPQVEAALDGQFQELRELVGRRLGRRFTPADRDQLLAMGELLSSRLVTAALAAVRLPAEWFDARLVLRTDDRFGGAIPAMSVLRTNARDFLLPLVHGGAIVVTQGFIGRTADGRTTTLGRGGSDFTAALLGAALQVDRVEIWTDVDGLMTADPRIVPSARLVTHATYDEAAELSAFGAKVLHPATQLPLVEAGIPIQIRNTFAAEQAGTWISADRGPGDHGTVRSISFKRGVTVVQIRAPRMLGAFGFLRQIFEIFERHEIVVDVLATSEVSVSLTVDDARRMESAAAELRTIGEVWLHSGRGVVAVVGSAIRETAGIAGRVYSAVADVNIEMISQGASATNLTFVVREEDGAKVVRELHREFFGEAT